MTHAPAMLVEYDRRALHTIVDAERARRGLRWADVARATGLEESMLSRWRHRHQGLREEAVVRLMAWADVAPCELLHPRKKSVEISKAGTRKRHL